MEFIPRLRFGPFEAQVRLDSGGMANVLLGVRKGVQSAVVIKVLKEQWLSNASIVQMFVDEGRILAGLRHPNVIRLVERGRADGLPFIALEYLAGENLGVLIRKLAKGSKRLSPATAATLALQAAEGLAHIHAARDSMNRPLDLIHGDISPENLFVGYDETLKVLDFGIARQPGPPDREGRTHLVTGKVSYLSPELILRRPVDGRSDLFCLGIVLWEALVGRRCFRGRDDLETFRQICRSQPPSPRSLRPEVPRPLEYIVQRCLSKNPEQRYPNATVLARDLADFLSSRFVRQHPGELTQVFDGLLAGRQARKRALIASLTRETILQEQSLDWSLDETTDQAVIAVAVEWPLTAEDPAIELREALHLGDEQRALEAYRLLSLQGMPDLEPAQAMVLADLLRRAGMILEAARLCRHAAERDPEGELAPVATFEGARLLASPDGIPDLAIEFLQHLLLRYPHHPLTQDARLLLCTLQRRQRAGPVSGAERAGEERPPHFAAGRSR